MATATKRRVTTTVRQPVRTQAAAGGNPPGLANLPPAPSITTGQPVYGRPTYSPGQYSLPAGQQAAQSLLNRLRGGGLQQVGNEQQGMARGMAGRGFATASPGLAALQQGARQRGERDIAQRSVQGLTQMATDEAKHRTATEAARTQTWADQLKQNYGRQGLDVSRYETLAQASLDSMANAARLASGLGRSRAEAAAAGGEDDALLRILMGYALTGDESRSYSQTGFPVNRGPSGSSQGVIAWGT